MNNRAAKNVYGFVIAILIAAVALLLIVNIVIQIDKRMEESARIKECQTSIKAYIQMRGMSAHTIEPELNCPTKYTTIEGNNKEEIKKEVIEKLDKCWKMWKKGEYVFIQGAAGMQYCHVCEVFDFEHKDILISKEEMGEFCEMNKIGEDKIFTYFAPVFHPRLEEIDPKDKLVFEDYWSNFLCQEIDTSKRYAVMYNELIQMIEVDKGKIVKPKTDPESPASVIDDVKPFMFANLKVGFVDITNLHTAFPLRIEYNAENLRTCHMTIAGQ